MNIVIFSIQNLETQLYSHLRGALRVGVKPPTLIVTMSYLAKYFQIDYRFVLRLLMEILKHNVR